MKVYLVPNAPASLRWHASQASAKTMARAYGGEVSPIRVAENGRDELVELLNGRELLAQPEPVTISGEPVEQQVERAVERIVSATPVTIDEATDIEDFILNRASVAQVEAIFARLGTRFREAIR
jgi:hypothetical protein